MVRKIQGTKTYGKEKRKTWLCSLSRKIVSGKKTSIHKASKRYEVVFFFSVYHSVTNLKYRKSSIKPPSPAHSNKFPIYFKLLPLILMIYCINQLRLKRFTRTDPVWFIQVLGVQICFWSSAALPLPACTWAFPFCVLVFMNNWYHHLC